MKVIRLEGSHDTAVEEFLSSNGVDSPSVLLYHYPLYRHMLEHIEVGEGYYLGVFEGDELVGYMPGFIRTHSLGTVYSSMPFFGPNGGVIVRKGIDRISTVALLLKSLKDTLVTLDRCISATVYTPFLATSSEMYRQYLEPDFTVEKCTQYTDLRRDYLTSSLSYDLRKAERSGIVIETGITPERLSHFYTLYAENCREFGIPLKPKRAIRYLAQEGGHKEGQVKLYFAYHRDRLIAGLMVLWGPQVVSYYMPASDTAFRSTQAPTLLIQQAMEEAKQAKKRIWNWESSPSRESGVYRFKKKWGSQESSYFIYGVLPQGEDVFSTMSPEVLEEAYPYFFVYPFDRLSS